jgi:hypothetical protein
MSQCSHQGLAGFRFCAPVSQMIHPSIAAALAALLRLKCYLRREKRFFGMKPFTKLEVQLKFGGISDSQYFSKSA